MTLRLRPALALALLPLAACHPKTGASSADSHAPGTTTASQPAACGKYPAGAPGVIRTFCDGPAVVKVTVAGVQHTLTGGVCSTEGGIFALNLGVVAGPDLAGPKPDYVGLSAPITSGHFTNATLAVNVDGKGYALTENSGDLTPAGGAFTGKAFGGGEAVTGSFTC
ncbi:MAG: hypothetical protein P4L73_04215 [Caulobacteraceae bacterium]|nr:hypothetical protein [Caulobacteraceae bacterium]